MYVWAWDGEDNGRGSIDESGCDAELDKWTAGKPSTPWESPWFQNGWRVPSPTTHEAENNHMSSCGGCGGEGGRQGETCKWEPARRRKETPQVEMMTMAVPSSLSEVMTCSCRTRHQTGGVVSGSCLLWWCSWVYDFNIILWRSGSLCVSLMEEV